ncbi:MAG TPA: 16S rRNA (uracil(1498)-N(3))-methyltransferase [Pirellulales bacterium]
MSERFFVDARIAGNSARLHGPEAHHLAHVMRAKIGEQVTLFDGSGAEYEAHIVAIGRAEVDLAVDQRREVARESKVELTIATALPKGDRQRWLVEKAVELGLAELAPLTTERSTSRPSDGALERLRRAVIEASKQCGRNRLMVIGEPRSWQAVVDSAPKDSLRLLAHPGGAPLRQVLSRLVDQENYPRVFAAVGPEGGFTDDEVQASLAAGFEAIDLGPRVLRIETAAIAIAAAFSW